MFLYIPARRYRIQSGRVSRMNNNNQPNMRPFGSESSYEDPYSVTGGGSSGGSSGSSGVRVTVNTATKPSYRPPKLPLRDAPRPATKVRHTCGSSLWARPAVPALTNLTKTPNKSPGDSYAIYRNYIVNYN